MKNKVIEISFLVEVTQETLFRQAAYRQALRDGETSSQAQEYLDDSKTGLDICLQMLLDPGDIDGAEILDVTTEVGFVSDWSSS